MDKKDKNGHSSLDSKITDNPKTRTRKSLKIGDSSTKNSKEEQTLISNDINGNEEAGNLLVQMNNVNMDDKSNLSKSKTFLRQQKTAKKINPSRSARNLPTKAATSMKSTTKTSIETIDLIESDEDDVILVSETGLKPRKSSRPMKTSKKRVQEPQNKGIDHRKVPPLTITKIQTVRDGMKEIQEFTVLDTSTISVTSSSDKFQLPTFFSTQQSSVLQKGNNSPIEPDEETLKARQWIEEFLSKLLRPTTQYTNRFLNLIQLTVPQPKYKEIKSVIRRYEVVSSKDAIPSDLLLQGREIMKLFINNGLITTSGWRLCKYAGITKLDSVSKVNNNLTNEKSLKKKNNCNKQTKNDYELAKGISQNVNNEKTNMNTSEGNRIVGKDAGDKNFSPDFHQGPNGTRKRSKTSGDKEYSPRKIMKMNAENLSGRRRSLRETKVNRNQHFSYDDEYYNDGHNSRKNNETTITLLSGRNLPTSTTVTTLCKENSSISGQRRRHGKKSLDQQVGKLNSISVMKKLRLEEGISFENPFETDLLTPAWVEEEVITGPAEVNRKVKSEDIIMEAHSPISNTKVFEEKYSVVPQYSTSFKSGKFVKEEQNSVEEELNENGQQNQLQPIGKSSCETNHPLQLVNINSFKNIHKEHHCRNTFCDMCIFCGSKTQYLVSHYVNRHRESEVLVSRLTDEDMTKVQNTQNIGDLSIAKNSNHIYAALCIFCNRDMKFALRYWWEHFTMHTGEYGYECSKCHFRRPRRQHAQKHADICQAYVRIAYDFDKKTNKIEGFTCKLCNFIQLFKKNIIKHIKTQHDRNTEIEETIAKVILFELPREANENFDTNPEGTESFQEQENYRYEECDSPSQYDDYEETSTVNLLESEDFPMTEDFLQYSEIMNSQNDLSYRIAAMLAVDDETYELSLNNKVQNTGESDNLEIGNSHGEMVNRNEGTNACDQMQISMEVGDDTIQIDSNAAVT